MMPEPTLLLPEVTRFRDLFWGAAKEQLHGHRPHVRRSRRDAPLKIGNFCTVDGGSGMEDLPHQSFYVGHTGLLVQTIRDKFLPLEDTLFFKLIVFPTGKTLVVCSYNVIIGSRWLARIDNSSLPEFVRATLPEAPVSEPEANEERFFACRRDSEARQRPT